MRLFDYRQLAWCIANADLNFQMTDLRKKSIEMLTSAFRMGELPDGTALPPEDLAARIEGKLLEVHGGTGDKYKGTPFS